MARCLTLSWHVGQVAISADSVNERVAVTFSVPGGSLNDTAHITLSVTGYTLSQLMCTFGPSGLAFNPYASLRLELGADRIDLDLSTIVGVHTHGGVSEPIPVTVEHLGDGGAVITMGVPGFSRYSLGE